MIRSLVNYSIILLSLLISFYLLIFVEENGFEFIWVLPLTFSFCFPLLYKVVDNNKLLLFFPAFIVVAFLRYVINPFLLCYTGTYFGSVMNIYPQATSLYKAVYLMSYELILCTLLIFLLFKRKKIEDEVTPNLVLSKSYIIYVIFIILTCALLALNPHVIYFFSFAIWGMEDFELSSLSTMAQTTIMFVITAKFVLFWILLSVIKKRHDKSNSPHIWTFLGILITIFLGFVYYGGNRAQFLFSLITHIYVFIILFPSYKKIVITISVILGIVVFSFMTDQRKYYDYYSYEKGLKKKALAYAQITSLYFGGLTNVAIGVEMADRYSYINKGEQLSKDITLPLVGLNKLISFDDRVSSNTLFNYVFFNSQRNISQILPSIAQGYFYGNSVFCILIDFVQLLFVFYLAFLLKKTNRMELVFIFNIVLFRFSIMFGQNIIQQLNGITMQLLFPICIYWLNNHVVLTDTKKYMVKRLKPSTLRFPR